MKPESASSTASKDKITDYKPAVVTGEYLRNLAENREFLIGTATRKDFWNIEKIYGETLEREFNILTPENQMKWQFIHPKRYLYDWNQADQQVADGERPLLRHVLGRPGIVRLRWAHTWRSRPRRCVKNRPR